MKKTKISAVSYTNTKPFVFGISHSEISEEIELTLDIPSVCAYKLVDKQADIGLIPVAALLDLPNYQLVSDYCIGANGAVNSVFIFSNKPIHLIQTLSFDTHSRTSNALASVLLKYHWKTFPRIVTEQADAFVEIGDRTFGKINSYPYVYDLADEWKRFTGLPFVFAVWASHSAIPDQLITKLNAAFKLGLDNRKRVLEDLPVSPNFDLEDYLMHKIDYTLDDTKREAINLFLSYLHQLTKVDHIHVGKKQ